MTAKGKIVFTLLFLAVVGIGVWKWRDKLMPTHPGTTQNAPVTPAASGNTTASDTVAAQASEVVETLNETPKLPAAMPYQPKDNVVDV